MRPLVLVIEDDRDIREQIAGVLAHHGFTTTTACDGADALAQVAAGLTPQVIVLDLMMPVMDGYGFLAARAELPALAAVPVVIVSAAPPDRELASSTWNELITKPFRADALVAAVQACLIRMRP